MGGAVKCLVRKELGFGVLRKTWGGAAPDALEGDGGLRGAVAAGFGAGNCQHPLSANLDSLSAVSYWRIRHYGGDLDAAGHNSRKHFGLNDVQAFARRPDFHPDDISKHRLRRFNGALANVSVEVGVDCCF
jgi:hypothetical protein